MGLRDEQAVGEDDATWVDSAEQREENPELAALLAPRPRTGVLPAKTKVPRPAPALPSVVIDRNEMTLPFQMPVHVARRPAPVPVRAPEESTVIMANVPVAPPSRPASRPDVGELPAFVASVETAIVTPPSLRAVSLDADVRLSRRSRPEPLSKRVVVSAVCMAIFTFGAAVGSISLGTPATSRSSQPHFANALARAERAPAEGLPTTPQAPTAWSAADEAAPAPAPAPAPRPKAAGRSATAAAPPKATAAPARSDSSKEDVSSAKQTSSAAAGVLENSLGGR